MFSGIVQEKGKFLRKFKGNNKYQLEIKAKKVLENIKTGDSIAVNGVCLTVVDYGSDYFRADVMPETLKATNLGDLEPDSILNLEQSLKANDFIGGHFVSGHVDSTAVVKSIKRENNAQIIEMEVDQETEKFIVQKGSVALNGVSLTVMGIENRILKISLIPESWAETNLSLLSAGDRVNIETDMLGKYVYKMLNNLGQKNRQETKVSKSFLAENGFI
ncbi:riboflavin synthase alpha chain [Halanaerobium congolense]|uniref:Riboflavin synthase n=1 Tax=Halanaerobium congolense TaxID=54121 RepID=A0A1I0CTD6_9FIRM|nr:riboflavin synthase [Halanaerobium congolense]PTX17472.1 riboflavin synthase alpha chain [Halanaerobium congolense]SDG06169.1 riboflavin synthase alpha chain [Halanaerobium congolense]SET22550.1 riboflavin synthase alpha chain [Halanaerobium congolense]SFP70821.1 riboflavin synthase alpha chain [Halanaerobium congolense]